MRGTGGARYRGTGALGGSRRPRIFGPEGPLAILISGSAALSDLDAAAAAVDDLGAACAALDDLVAAAAAEVEMVEDLSPELAPTIFQQSVDKKNLDVTASSRLCQVRVLSV